MSDEAKHIAIDLGASGGRVALGTVRGGKLHVEVLHRFPNGGVPVQGGLYWDFVGLWREILYGMKIAADRGGVVSVGVNSWGVDYGLLDENNLVLDGVHHYRDSRSDGVMDEMFRVVPRDEIYDTTGIQFMPINTAYQLVAHDRRAPGILKRAKRFLMVSDLLHFWLCGEKYCEVTNASTTQLYDPRLRAWSDELLAKLAIPRWLFGDIVEPGTVLGDLTDEVVKHTGLQGVKVIVPATHDTACAVAACPAKSSEGWAYISSGTWSLVGVESPNPVISEQTLKLNLTNEAGVKGTTRLLKNIMGLWILQECRRAWGSPDYVDLYAEAEHVRDDVALVDPDDLRFLAPADDMPDRVRAFCEETGQRPPSTRGEITRCILESLAHKSAGVLQQLESVTGVPIHTVHVVGGGSQIAFLNQLIADASGRTIVAGPTEATLMGNLLIQAEAIGRIPEGGIRAVVRDSETLATFEPRSQLSADRRRIANSVLGVG
jgi:rhamnulokinase